MKNPRIWLVGNKGMLGRDLAESLGHFGFNITGSDIECDVADPAALEQFANTFNPDWIINCSAYTAVDKAEDEVEATRKINAIGPANLVAISAVRGARLIHISTDYVFNGKATRPYKEDDEIAPLGVYGRTKAEGEQAILASSTEAYILRTAWLYGRYGRNFVATMLRLLRERGSVNVVNDQHGSPTHTLTLCRVIGEIIERKSLAPGIYHVTDSGATTWFEFATEICRRAVSMGMLPAGSHVKPIATHDFPTRAARPSYSVLSKDKISSWLQKPLPAWQDSLQEYLQLLQNA